MKVIFNNFPGIIVSKFNLKGIRIQKKQTSYKNIIILQLKYLQFCLVSMLLLAFTFGSMNCSNNDPTTPEITESKSNGSNTLFIVVEKTGSSLRVTADLNDKDTSYTIPEAAKIFASSNTIDNIISSLKGTSNLIKEIDNLSSVFITPLNKLIEECNLLDIKINPASIKIPFEFLKLNNEFIYLKKPIVYSYSKFELNNLPLITIEGGLIISDPTADPENACGTIAGEYTNSQFYFIENANLNKIKNTTGIDFILMSVHGRIETATCSSYMKINNEELSPPIFSQRKLKLVYFDSCHLGLGLNFVKNFYDLEAGYFLGPIISNEAGNSSTKTIINFFNNLHSNNPVESLFKAKQTLKEHFNSSLVRELYSAAPFRIYKLN